MVYKLSSHAWKSNHTEPHLIVTWFEQVEETEERKKHVSEYLNVRTK
jgi:hypothetical protein